MAFADNYFMHMMQHGLDNVFYMENVAVDGTGGRELFTYHTQCSKEVVEAHSTDPHCFNHDHSKAALKESAQWLSNLLDLSLRTSLRSVIIKRQNRPQLWMTMVRKV